MIKINLASRKQSVVAAGASKATGSGIGGLGGLTLGIALDRFKDLNISDLAVFRKAVLPLIVAVLAYFTLENFKSTELEKLDAETLSLNEKKTQLQAEANKMKQHEETKKALEADEFTIRTKIDTIQKLVAGRTVPPKVLISLASGMPENVWLSEFRVKDSQVTIQGFSLDMGQVSDFMRLMGESAYFSDLNLKNSQQVKGESASGEVTSFELTAKRK